MHDVKKAKKFFEKKSKVLEATGILIHPDLRLTLELELRNILLFASPGSGKTQVILPIIQRIRERGDPVILYDYKGDYTEAFGEDQGTLILSPFDARGVRWDIATDVDTELKAAELAAVLFPTAQSKEPFFRIAAQDLLTGVLCRLQAEKPLNWTIFDLVALLSDRDEIVASCKHYRKGALSTFSSIEDRQASGILGELRAGTIQLEFLAKAWRDTTAMISLTQWVANPSLQQRYPVIIVRGDQSFPKLAGFLTAQIFGLFIKQVLSLSDSHDRRMWVILDEFGNIPKINELGQMVSSVRSKGLRVVAAIQDISQVVEAYTENTAQTFFNCFGILLAGINRGQTARWLSDNFGKNKLARDVHGESTSRQSGRSGRGKTESSQQQIVNDSVMLDTDFSNLPVPSAKTPALFWARISDWPIGKLAYQMKSLPKKYDAIRPPWWITAKPVAAQKDHAVQESPAPDHRPTKVVPKSAPGGMPSPDRLEGGSKKAPRRRGLNNERGTLTNDLTPEKDD